MLRLHTLETRYLIYLNSTIYLSICQCLYNYNLDFGLKGREFEYLGCLFLWGRGCKNLPESFLEEGDDCLFGVIEIVASIDATIDGTKKI